MLSNISDSRSTRVELTDAEGSPIGSLEIPRDLTRSPNSTLIITFTDGNQNSSNLALGEVVLDITLLNSEGQEITDLDSPLTVCFPRPNNTGHKDLCLGFYSEVKGRWKCEDLCLIKKGNELCGHVGSSHQLCLAFDGQLERRSLHNKRGEHFGMDITWTHWHCDLVCALRNMSYRSALPPGAPQS